MESKRFIGKVFRHFRILEPLGHGGMGLVFKALNTHLNKIVAIKMIAPGLALNEKLLNRFKTEALALARLENPHIVRILDLLEDQGQWFIVMEYIEGETLQQRLKEMHPLRLSEAFDITLQILSALQHAHSASIIHRDIKPSNILIAKDNTIKVTDFGLAKIQANTLVHTQHSAVGGTLYYMSPEQIRSLKETDHRTDIYSLGITIYQMVTGRIPFDAHQTDFDIREAIVRRQFPKPSTFNPYLPPEIDELVMKAIAKNPDDRFQSAVEMIQEMERIREKLKGKLDQEIRYDSDIEKEINYTDYPFNIQEDFSGESSIPPIPVEGGTPPPNDNGRKHAQEPSGENWQQKPEEEKRPINNHSKKKYWWLALFPLAILLFFLYYFLGQPQKPGTGLVRITSQPQQARLIINNKVVGLTPVDSLQVTPGPAYIRLQKKGFQELDTLLNVTAGKIYGLHFRLQALPAVSEVQPKKVQAVAMQPKSQPIASPANISRISLTFTSQPAGAKLFINNLLLGNTPVTHRFKSDRQLIVKLVLPGYATQVDTIFVTAKSKHRFHYLLIPKPVKLVVRTNISGAQLTVDGKPSQLMGKNKSLALKPGLHVLAVTKPGYTTQEKTVTLKPNVPKSVTFHLQPLKTKLKILVLPYGNIYIDGKLLKRETNIRETFILPVGKHTLKITHPVFGTCVQSVALKPDSTTSLVFDFKKPEAVRVLAFDESGKPQYAQIIVDGKPFNQYTPGLVKLTIGKHQISVRKEGFAVAEGNSEIMVLPNTQPILKFKRIKQK